MDRKWERDIDKYDDRLVTRDGITGKPDTDAN